MDGVVHVSDVGLDTLKNGALLAEADKSFDILVTIDKNMRFQSSLKGLSLAVVVLDAKSNDIDQLRPFVPELERRLDFFARGQFTVLS